MNQNASYYGQTFIKIHIQNILKTLHTVEITLM